MTTLSAKLADLFRTLKTDAVPRAPRTPQVVPEDVPAQENNENHDTTNGTDNPEEPQVIIIEEPDDDLKKDKKSKAKKSSFSSKFQEGKPNKPEKTEKRISDGCIVNTQATGNVINIVNSSKVHCGDEYYLGVSKPKSKMAEHESEDEVVKKCNDIRLLMEAKVKPEHEYLDVISNNLGKNWYGLFIKLGFLKGRIETMEINTREYGVNEARYKLLLDWVRNDKVGTLGCLATKLWEHGDRQLVQQLALLYKKNSYK